ncbi:MAG: hypothetical protein Q6365_002470, partial [Candidatus Sigynarchaeota archaeon]
MFPAAGFQPVLDKALDVQHVRPDVLARKGALYVPMLEARETHVSPFFNEQQLRDMVADQATIKADLRKMLLESSVVHAFAEAMASAVLPACDKATFDAYVRDVEKPRLVEQFLVEMMAHV